IITVEMKSMTAWQVRAWGEPETMSLASDAPIPEPGPGQIRIANRAMAANFFDILQIQGKYQVKPPFPFTPGAEVVGIVDAVGAGVTAVRAGDRVMAAPAAAAFAEDPVAPAAGSFAISDGWDCGEAGGIRLVYSVTYFSL